MSQTSQHPPSQLFTVRIWSDSGGQMRTAWRGKVECVQSGSWRYFHHWHDLTAFLQSNALPSTHAEEAESEVDDGQE